ncbi:MAG: PBP1A family penicillin-binding protein [Candidatus Zixiibacteriota bacterium]
MAWFNTDNQPLSKDGRRWRTSLVTLIGLIAILVVLIGVRTYRVYQSELPSFEQLHNIEPSLATRVYDRNGVLLKEFYSENRALTPFSEIPRPLIDMLMATEDQEFYSHWGINFRRALIVAATNLLHLELKAGASTITQQLSRMLFLTQKKTFERKIKEALTAIKLERTYSKDEILEMYLNQYYFSRGAYGIAAASHLFFNKRPRELSLDECAILIGMLKGPNINSPVNNPEKAFKARNRVLYSYYEWGGISEPQYDSLKELAVRVTPPSEREGIAPYFTEWIRQHLLEKYGESVLYSGGLRVYTSLDASLQRVAEEAVNRKIDSLRSQTIKQHGSRSPDYTYYLPDTLDSFGRPIRVSKLVQGAFVAIDNATGDVLSMVGGRSFEESEFNRAVQALRQPGSSFKPFVYTACIDNGYKTTDIVDDNPLVLDIPGSKQWRPHNFDDQFLGPITIRDALRLSRNLATIRLLLKVTPDQAIFYARKMGITTPLPAVPSLAIGVGEVRLVELVSALSTFPDKGIHIPYRSIHRIVDRYGKVLEDNSAVRKEEVLSAQTAFLMVDIMRSVVDAGTGQRARWMGFTRPAGGKTGTSDNFCDNWFVGYTPQITAGVWVGFDDKTSLGGGEDGARNAVPVWTEYMLKAHDSLPVEDFEEPEGIVHLDVCTESGELATDRCRNVRTDVFAEGNQPTVACHLHPSRGMYRLSDRYRRARQADSLNERGHF